MLKYSYEVKTDKDKLEFSVRTEELLRLEHNEMGARFRNAEISESEWSNYLKNDFVPKSRMISGNVAKVRDDMGINTKEKIALEKINLENYKVSTKFNIDLKNII